MHTEAVTFPSRTGESLAGRLDHPAGSTRAIALFAHCFTCSKDLHAVRAISARLNDHGIAVLRFDFTGLGHSEGEFANTNFSSNVDDLVAAADWLRQTYGPPSVLIGHSLGGAAVISAAGRVPEVEGVVTIGAPSDPGHVQHLFAGATDEIESSGAAEVELAGRHFTVTRQFLEDISEQSLGAALAELDVPLMIMHAPEDDTVSVDHASELFHAANHPKSFVALDGADHLLTDRRIADYAAGVIGAWADRYLPQTPGGADDVLVPASEGEVVVAERGTGTFAQVVRVADRHVLLADEPIGIGDDTGPTPYDYLLAGLGACTSMTLRMYADRKGWPLESVAVRLSHDRVHAEDCGECEKTSGMVDKIDREVVIEGNLDDEQRAKLLEIADKCPVHRTLHNEILIPTELADA